MTTWYVMKRYDRLNTYMVSYLMRKKGTFFIKKTELPFLMECIANETFEQVIDGMETHFGEELSQTIHRTWVDWENKDRDDQIILFPRITKWIECELDPYNPEKILTVSKKKYMDYFMQKLGDYLTEATTEKIEDFLNEVNEYGLEWWILARTRNFPNIPSDFLVKHGEPIRPGKFLRLFHRDRGILSKDVLDLMGETLAVQLRRNSMNKPTIEISDTPSEIYTMETGFTSCMKNKDKTFFQIYDDIPSCKIAYMVKDGILVGRALLWDDVEVHKGHNYSVYIKMMDRIYFAEDRIKTMFQIYAEENGYWYKSEQKINHYTFIDPKNGDRREMTLLRVNVGFPFEENMYENCPYMDTFPKLRIGSKYVASYWTNGPGEQVNLQSVEGVGGALTMDYICCMCNNPVTREDARYYEGEYYCEDCYDDMFAPCDECGEPTSREEIIWGYFDGWERWLCPACIKYYRQGKENRFWSNDKCMEAFGKGGEKTTITPDDLENFEECSICCEIHHSDNIRRDKYGDPYCEECFEKDVKDEDKP